jgi:hypothetical protein
MGEKMKYVLITLMMLCCASLWAEDGVDSLSVKKDAGIGVWAYAEYGFGGFNGVSLSSLQAGLGLELLHKIQVKAYVLSHQEAVDFFDNPKYWFKGLGVRIGPVFHSDKLAVSPSIGLESGTIRIGEGEYIEGFLGHSYASYREEDILYIPVSLEFQIHIGRVILLSGRTFADLNSDYPVMGLSFGLGLGWM